MFELFFIILLGLGGVSGYKVTDLGFKMHREHTLNGLRKDVGLDPKPLRHAIRR